MNLGRSRRAGLLSTRSKADASEGSTPRSPTGKHSRATEQHLAEVQCPRQTHGKRREARKQSRVAVIVDVLAEGSANDSKPKLLRGVSCPHEKLLGIAFVEEKVTRVDQIAEIRPRRGQYTQSSSARVPGMAAELRTSPRGRRVMGRASDRQAPRGMLECRSPRDATGKAQRLSITICNLTGTCGLTTQGSVPSTMLEVLSASARHRPEAGTVSGGGQKRASCLADAPSVAR